MSYFIKHLIFEHNLNVMLQKNGIVSNLERFNFWMRDRVKSKFITDQEMMNKAYLKIEYYGTNINK